MVFSFDVLSLWFTINWNHSGLPTIVYKSWNSEDLLVMPLWFTIHWNYSGLPITVYKPWNNQDLLVLSLWFPINWNHSGFYPSLYTNPEIIRTSLYCHCDLPFTGIASVFLSMCTAFEFLITFSLKTDDPITWMPKLSDYCLYFTL